MPNSENLISLADRTPEERAEIARKGGQASGEAKRARKTLREELEILMQEGDRQTRISTALVDAAEAGNVSAFNSIRDTLGEKPKTEVSAEIGGRWFSSIDEMTEEQLEIAKKYLVPEDWGNPTPIEKMVKQSLSINAQRDILNMIM